MYAWGPLTSSPDLYLGHMSLEKAAGASLMFVDGELFYCKAYPLAQLPQGLGQKFKAHIGCRSLQVAPVHTVPPVSLYIRVGAAVAWTTRSHSVTQSVWESG